MGNKFLNLTKMFSKTILFILAIGIAQGFSFGGNVSHRVSMNSNINQVMMAEIKAIDTPKGEVLLPKDLQSSVTPSGKMKNVESRLFGICFYLKKTYEIPKKQCLR